MPVTSSSQSPEPEPQPAEELGPKPGTKIRILGVGDSITVGWPNDGTGNGYRMRLKTLLFCEITLPFSFWSEFVY